MNSLDDIDGAAMATPPARRSGPGLALLIGTILLAFAVGAVLAGWMVTQSDYLDGALPAISAPAPATSAAVPAPPTAAPLPAPAPADDAARTAVDLTTTTLRVAELEAQLARIGLAANDAADEAGRAEALLALTAARRALDQGVPLGAAGDALARRFAASDTATVAALTTAAQTAVTREDLLYSLNEARDRLLRPAGSAGALAAARQGLAELFILRRAGAPNPTAEARLDRAARLVASGNVTAAAAEVRRLPRASAAREWLAMADRYIRGRAALDRLEARVLSRPAASIIAPAAAAAPAAAGAAATSGPALAPDPSAIPAQTRATPGA